jgi:DNA ligase 1
VHEGIFDHASAWRKEDRAFVTFRSSVGDRRQNLSVLLADVVTAWQTVAGTSSRLRKVEALAALLQTSGPAGAAVVVPWMSGDLRQRRTGIGWALLRDAPAPAAASTLTLDEVDSVFESAADLAGPGSAGEQRRIVHDVFGLATADEQQFLRGLISGELRQGALEGVMIDAVAKASGAPVSAVRRAAMLCGAIAPVAADALAGGADGLASYGLQVGRPVQPMLAATASSVGEALDELGEAAVEWKLDGIRAQLHKDGTEVAVFSRSLDDITKRVPEIVKAAMTLPADCVVLDGEAIALRADGRPRPFQETGARAATRDNVAVALSLFAFDVLHLNGADLLDLPGRARHTALTEAVPDSLRIPRIETTDIEQAQAFFTDAVARGHEGVVVKSLTAPYEAGRRGSGWRKVKPVHTLDLVVLAAEWGHGRRRGFLSNLHLGARDPSSGEFVMLGKTFKGMTDELLRWQTARFLELEISHNDWQVFVKPEVVVEIAFDGVQTSPRYPGGVALRFARVIRYRDDKRPDQADTIDTVRAFLT